jgi:hypothetical protein
MGLFTRKQHTPKEPQADRYAGRPLLILLENYVLSCIGQLPADKEAGLLSVTQRVFGGGDDWKATMRSTLQLGESLDESLRQMWTTNQERARQANVTLAPEDFARMIVDQNFAHLIQSR